MDRATQAAVFSPQILQIDNKRSNFYKEITIALLCGVISGYFNVGLTLGQDIHFAATPVLFQTLPAIFLVTLGDSLPMLFTAYTKTEKITHGRTTLEIILWATIWGSVS